MRSAVVAGLGVAVPPQVVTNDDLAARLDTSDEWIRTRTGIAARHVAADDVATSHLAVEAGARALKSAGVSEVDLVVVATTTPDRVCPATAPKVAAQLGLQHIGAFDVGAVCSGFVYGLATAAGLITAGVAESVLLVGADTITRFVDPEDRSTAVIFGDGAGGVVLRAGDTGEPGAVGPFDLGSDGERAELIVVGAGGSLHPSSRPVSSRSDHYLVMDGREVYRHAIPRMVASCRKVLARAGWDVGDVDRLVAHQANARILDGVASRLGVPPERCALNIERYGNTAAASIPLALAEAELRPGERVLLTAFGAGLTWGSAVLVWPDVEVVV